VPGPDRPLSEFDIIREIFAPLDSGQRRDVVLGIGDDAAVVTPPAGAEIVMALDVLNEGVHFPVNTPAHAVGHKALAVNLSDLAAMGAKPLWFTLGLCLPVNNDAWLRDFAQGLHALAAEHDIVLIGGDTTRGPLSISVNVCGAVEKGAAVTRGGANSDDVICVTGPLGDAALALDAGSRPAGFTPEDITTLETALNYPTPRVASGLALARYATAAIDISDGFAQDLGHLGAASELGATVRLEDIPLSDEYRRHIDRYGVTPAVTFGDDYELLVTIAPHNLDIAISAARATGVTLTPVGVMTNDSSAVTFIDNKARPVEIGGGFDHFKID